MNSPYQKAHSINQEAINYQSVMLNHHSELGHMVIMGERRLKSLFLD